MQTRSYVTTCKLVACASCTTKIYKQVKYNKNYSTVNTLNVLFLLSLLITLMTLQVCIIYLATCTNFISSSSSVVVDPGFVIPPKIPMTQRASFPPYLRHPCGRQSLAQCYIEKTCIDCAGLCVAVVPHR